jgi:hypothetical protein
MLEQKLEQRQARLLELAATITLELNAARFELQQAADENRQLRHEAENVNLKVYTEAEAASELKIGESTLRRLRTGSSEWPCARIGDLVRYSNFHLVEIMELLDRRKERQVKKGKRAHLRQVEARAS